MEKLEFLELLKVENVYSLMSSSEIEKRPVIDLFDYTKSDHDKICDFIKTEFNYAYNVIIGSYNGGRKLVLKEFKNIRNKYLKVSHVLTDEEIHIIALDMFLNLFVGMDGDYLLFVMEYLEEKSMVLNNQDAHKILRLMNLNPAEEYRVWFEEVKPVFISIGQVDNFVSVVKEKLALNI